MEAMKHEKKSAGGDLSRDQDKAEPGPEEALQEGAPAEEAERDDNSVEVKTSDPDPTATDVLEREAEPFQHGDALDSPFGPLPKRSLAGMAIMLIVAVVVYLLVWALLGTWGLLLGLIPAAALGLLAAREWGRRQETA